jgi:hypothetical protein
MISAMLWYGLFFLISISEIATDRVSKMKPRRNRINNNKICN